MAEEKCQFVFHAGVLALQLSIDVNDVRRFESRTKRTGARLARVFVEPADRELMLARDVQQCIERQWHLARAGCFSRAFDVGKIVLVRLLPDAHEQSRELIATGARLREQFRQRVLQHFFREQKSRFERHRRRSIAPRCAIGLHVRVLVQEPAAVLAKYSGQQFEQFGRGHALARFHHAEIRHGRCVRRVQLHAPRGQFIQRQAIALAQRAQLGPQKMPLADQAGHV